MIADLPVALSDTQRATIDAYVGELERLNRRVNLVARPARRADLERHVRHCLALATRPFAPGAVVVDWGSGGGLPALPLAVAFPETTFVAVDTVGKKSEAVKLFARRLGLDNLTAWNGRAEAYDGPAPTRSVSRATAPLATLWAWHERARASDAADLLCLKGGDLGDERAALDAAWPGLAVETEGLADVLGAEWADKAIVSVAG
ncbi:16S rRNA (guanine(527)-N(7))-methyltransferase RsmG [Rubrivirga sp. IMCC45206]|uniref:16S rRNA (guanine(527)-N(7))-methyltransferase RsmG n=1 Tax=Rubrivirga sp. IMCC45206 TaxID=3391614 RepID=UPI00398FDA27